jgi:ParB-like chromosome segregation protein Spo0J
MSNKLEIKYVNIEDIKPYENNPRFNDNAVEYVKNSIKEFGFKVPMILDKDNKIVTRTYKI